MHSPCRPLIRLASLALAICALALPRGWASQDLSTLYAFSVLAGTVSRGSVDGKVADARFYDVEALVFDNAGRLYVADGGTIRKVSTAGVVTTLAGAAFLSGSADGIGPSARFSGIRGIAVDAAGNVYVSSRIEHTIRKVAPDGTVTTLAGVANSNGSTDGSGTMARFNQPMGIAVAATGDLFVADNVNHTIRKITSAGVVSTIAGQAGVSGNTDGLGQNARFNGPRGLTIDSAGNLYVVDGANQTIRRISASGEVTTVANTAGMNLIEGITVDLSGNIYVSDFGHTLSKITAGGVISPLAGKLNVGGDTDGPGSSASFDYPAAVAADASGNIYVADNFNNTVRKVTSAGLVTTFAGVSANGAQGYVDGAGTSARFRNPWGIVMDASGTLYVADGDNHVIRKISPAGVVSTFVGSADASGNTDGTGSAARFGKPGALARDSAGTLYVKDRTNLNIRKITASGVVTTLSTGTSDLGDMAVDGGGNLYVMDNWLNQLWKVAPDGTKSSFAGGLSYVVYETKGDGTGANAAFLNPMGITMTPTGFIVVTDGVLNTIRTVSAGASVSTLTGQVFSYGWEDGARDVATFHSPAGLAADTAGNLFVCDMYSIRKITASGVTSTLATSYVRSDNPDANRLGGILYLPHSITVDSQGALYVVQGHVILKGERAGAPVITTQPQNQSATAGGNVQFSITASGVPAPVYQWSFNGAPFEGATGSTLSFSNVRSSDAGNYSVTVTNALGTVTSSTATLSISTSSGGGGGNGGASGGGKGGGGGGAPSPAFLIALLALAGIRRLTGKTPPSA